MSFTRTQAVFALDFLTGKPETSENVAAQQRIHDLDMSSPGAKPPADQSYGTIALARRLRVTKEEAKDIEAALVNVGLLAPSPGWQGNPRYIMTDAGFAYLVLARKSPLSAAEIVPRVPRGVFAGDAITMHGTLLKMNFMGLVSTADGGRTFRLA